MKASPIIKLTIYWLIILLSLAILLLVALCPRDALNVNAVYRGF